MAYIEVCSGVFQVGGGSLSHPDDCCVYLVANDTGAVLIDTGCQAIAHRIIKNIECTGTSTASVKTLIVTHGHIDHIGGLNWLKQELGATVVAHYLELPAIAEGKPQLTAAAYYGIDYKPVAVEQVINSVSYDVVLGSSIITCLLTLGHTPGSISVYTDILGKRILFGQDIHGPFSANWGSDLKAWQASMQMLIDLDADILCEGHFGVIEGRQSIRDFINRYRRQYQQKS